MGEKYKLQYVTRGGFGGFVAWVWIFSRMVYMRLTQNKLHEAMFILMKEYVTYCNSEAHWCVFNRFWTTSEVYGREEQTIVALSYTVILVQFVAHKYNISADFIVSDAAPTMCSLTCG